MRILSRNCALAVLLPVLLAACGGSGGDGSPAATDQTAPSVPTSVVATRSGSVAATISWQGSTDVGTGVAGYRIYRNGGTAAVASVGASSHSYVDAGLAPDTTYTYSVSAFDAAVPSNESGRALANAVVRTVDTLAPNAPGNLAAIAQSTSAVSLTWSAADDNPGGDGVTGYRVLRNGAQIASVGSASLAYVDSALAPGTTYTYVVRAVDAAGNVSGNSASAAATTLGVADGTPPSTPQNLTATAQTASTTIVLAWSASTDAGGSGIAGYRVFRGGVQVASTAAATLVYVDVGLAANTAYSYSVRAIDGAGNVSAASNTATATTHQPPDATPPSAPQGLTASALGSTSISISWQAATDSGGSGLASYRILRNGTPVASVGAGTLSYVDNGLAASTSYAYVVRAVDGAGNVSGNSPSASATTQAAADTTPPSVPQGPTATAQSASAIGLTWVASTDNVGGSGLAGYYVNRGGSRIAQVSASTLSYADSGLDADTLYSYTVQAFDVAGNVSGNSSNATARTQAAADTTPPSAPQNLAATAQLASTAVDLSWSASTDVGGSGVVGYRVFRDGVPVANLGASGLSYTDVGLTANTAYAYTVRALDGAGNVSTASNIATVTTNQPPDTTAPTVPQNLAATAQGGASIGLAWQAATDSGGSGLASYRILRNGNEIATVDATTLAFVDTGLVPSTSYAYTVRAADVAGNVSADSNLATASTSDTLAPTAPGSVVATAQSASSIGLSWAAAIDNAGGTGVAGYRILRDGTQIAAVGSATSSYVDTGLTASTSYSYVLRAVDGAGNVSVDSAGASATTQAIALPVGMTARPSNTVCVAPPRPGTGGALSLGVARAFPNIDFGTPISGAFMPKGDSSRWIVTALDGRIFFIANSDATTTIGTFADLSGRVVSGGEKGLFGLAFHPDYPADPRVFVSYTASVSGQLTSRISSFRSTDGGVTLNAATETVLVSVQQPADNHNGGFIAFGGDGFLYFGLGDGGSGGDPWGSIGNGQNKQTLLGKILRINIDATAGALPYAIPPTNPYAGNAACNATGTGSANCPEIYAIGFRNPWKGSFDRQTGQLWIGDVGQNTWEEVDRVVLGGNYGWRCREGAADYNTDCGGAVNLLEPVAQYANQGGASVVGGYVYRGSANPALVGHYVFADFGAGLFSIEGTASPTVTMPGATSVGRTTVAFAEDNAGELLVVDYFGSLWRVQASGGSTNTIPDQLSATGCMDTAALIPYAPNAPFWSDGAIKRRWMALPDNGFVDTSGANGDWNFPNGTVLVKDFTLDNRLIETRLFMRHPDGVWAGYTYEWNDAQTDATRVIGGKNKTVGAQVWRFPSETECLQCHTAAAGYSLGLETAQQNGDFGYPAAPSPPFTGNLANQVHTLNSIGLLSPALSGAPSGHPAYPNPYGTNGTIAERARAYLHTNCSQCHRPGGPTGSTMDLRYQTTMAATQACNATPADDLGVTGAKIIKPGDAASSVLHMRMSVRGTNQMPPLGSNVVDSAGALLISQWISQMDASCQ